VQVTYKNAATVAFHSSSSQCGGFAGLSPHKKAL